VEEFHLLADVVKMLAFGPEERGLLKREIGQPYKIRTIPHQPWQIMPIPIPAASWGAFMELVKERVRTGLYKQTNSSSLSPIFAVLKQDKASLRIVHDL
jgi:hypothetical protein